MERIKSQIFREQEVCCAKCVDSCSYVGTSQSIPFIQHNYLILAMSQALRIVTGPVHTCIFAYSYVIVLYMNICFTSSIRL